MFKFNKHHHHHHPQLTSQSSSSSQQQFYNNCPILDTNQLGQQFEVTRLVGTAGPEHVWKIYDGWRKSDGKVSIYYIIYLCIYNNMGIVNKLVMCVSNTMLVSRNNL